MYPGCVRGNSHRIHTACKDLCSVEVMQPPGRPPEGACQWDVPSAPEGCSLDKAPHGRRREERGWRRKMGRGVRQSWPLLSKL